MIDQNNLESESGFRRGVRLAVGAMLILKALLLLFLAFMLSIFGPLIGGLSFLAGAGGATDDQVETGWRWIGLMVATPYIATALMMIAGIRMLRDLHPNFVAVACGFVGVIEVALMFMMQGDQDAAFMFIPMIVLILTNVIGVVGGIWMKQWGAADFADKPQIKCAQINADV